LTSCCVTSPTTWRTVSATVGLGGERGGDHVGPLGHGLGRFAGAVNGWLDTSISRPSIRAANSVWPRQGLGDLARPLDQGLVDLARAVVQRLGDAVGVGLERFRDVVDLAADRLAEVGEAGGERGLHVAGLVAERGDEGRAALADQHREAVEALLEAVAEFAAVDRDHVGEARAGLDDAVVDRIAASLDRVGDLGSGVDDLLVDRHAARLDGVGDVAAQARIFWWIETPRLSIASPTMLGRLDTCRRWRCRLSMVSAISREEKDALVDGRARLDLVGDLAAGRRSAGAGHCPGR
jgi:hypothetical protein